LDRIIKGYFNYANAQFIANISIQDIINILKKHELLIMPTNGQLLSNPYFTPPGPERHNLLINDYDAQTKEFITNDPGTKNG